MKKETYQRKRNTTNINYLREIKKKRLRSKIKIMTPKEKTLSLLDKIKIESNDKNEIRRNSNLGLILCNEVLESFIIKLTPEQFEYWNEVRNEFYKLNKESE